MLNWLLRRTWTTWWRVCWRRLGKATSSSETRRRRLWWRWQKTSRHSAPWSLSYRRAPGIKQNFTIPAKNKQRQLAQYTGPSEYSAFGLVSSASVWMRQSSRFILKEGCKTKMEKRSFSGDWVMSHIMRFISVTRAWQCGRWRLNVWCKSWSGWERDESWAASRTSLTESCQPSPTCQATPILTSGSF